MRKMRNSSGKTLHMAKKKKKMKSMQNEKHTLQELEYVEKNAKRGK